MPSPLPGMDPFLEGEEWEDFHTTFHTVLREKLSPRLEPQYLVRVETRVYVEHPGDDRPQTRRLDVALLRDEGAGEPAVAVGAAVATVTPVACILPMPEERRETYLVIRERQSREIITVIDTLSPANKRRGGDGRGEYLRKREETIRSQSHLVELDLLRAGERLPTVGPLPPGDYYAIVSRSHRRPRGDVYAWTFRHRLPSIPIPLKREDPEVPVDLQGVFDTVYDRARYNLSLDYTRPLDPPLPESQDVWLSQLLAANKGGPNAPGGV